MCAQRRKIKEEMLISITIWGNVDIHHHLKSKKTIMIAIIYNTVESRQGHLMTSIWVTAWVDSRDIVKSDIHNLKYFEIWWDLWKPIKKIVREFCQKHSKKIHCLTLSRHSFLPVCMCLYLCVYVCYRPIWQGHNHSDPNRCMLRIPKFVPNAFFTRAHLRRKRSRRRTGRNKSAPRKQILVVQWETLAGVFWNCAHVRRIFALAAKHTVTCVLSKKLVIVYALHYICPPS